MTTMTENDRRKILEALTQGKKTFFDWKVSLILCQIIIGICFAPKRLTSKFSCR